MADRCRCERCNEIVRRNRGSWLRKVAFAGLYLITMPYAWLLFVAGPGLLGVLPIVVGIGLSIGALFRDWAFPTPLCEHCGASLEWAPAVSRQVASSALAPEEPISSSG